MKQGDLYLVNLALTIHTEIGKTRPALILSIDEMNDQLPRVLVAPISSSAQRVYLQEYSFPQAREGYQKTPNYETSFPQVSGGNPVPESPLDLRLKPAGVKAGHLFVGSGTKLNTMCKYKI